MPDTTPPTTPASHPDPLGPWAPYARWLLLVAILVFGPKLGITPGTLPPLPDLSPVTQRLDRIEAGQAQAMRAAGVPAQ